MKLVPRVLLGLLVGCTLSQCSLWVSAEAEQIGCADEGKLGQPACGTGFVCARHACVRCADEEICGDRIDNDCNGSVDDGCSHVSGSGGGGHGPPALGEAGAAKTAGAGGSR